jgi:integrase
VASRYALNKNKYLLDPEYDHLERNLQFFKYKDPRNCLALLLALKTGARAQELLNLRKNDLNTYDQTIFIKGLKGSDDRELPLAPEIFEELEAYSRPLAASDLLFPISYHRIRQIWCDYRPVAKKFHSLRHTFAIRLYKKTKDIRLLQVALGHRNVTNTMIYADYVYSQSELKKLIL